MSDLVTELMDDRALMKKASRELSERGVALAKAEAEYQTAKHKRVFELKDEKVAATLIQLTIKGDPAVSQAMFLRDCAEVEYKSALEALNVYKLDARILEAQIDREFRG